MKLARSALELSPDSVASRLCREVARRGGCAFVVGGWVRDRLLGRPDSDLDLEVHGLSRPAFEELLEGLGPLRRVGAAFAVYLVGDPPLQASLVESDGAVGSWDEGFARAARRRDLTINSLGWDPSADLLLDPYSGRQDLARRRLVATDAARFGEDPLRVLRVARLAAALDFEPAPSLVALCQGLDLAGVSAERIYAEWRRMLLESPAPSLAHRWLRELGALRVLPELARLIDVPQDPRWHPEGCVWVHTSLVLDQAAKLRVGDSPRDLLLMLACACHDLGKADTTTLEEGRVRALRHELRSARLSEDLLMRLRAPHAVVRGVTTLVRHHLAPVALVDQAATGRAYRKLQRSLAEGGVDAALLARVARADQLGRSTEAALAGRFPQGERFLAEIDRHALSPGPPQRDVVLGRHVLARGLATGREIGRILSRCRELQDETGWTDPERILDRVSEEEAG